MCKQAMCEQLSSWLASTSIWKIFEELIFNEIYSFLDREKLLNTNESGFRPFDSYVNHEIISSFDCNPSLEVPSIFLGISKALA